MNRVTGIVLVALGLVVLQQASSAESEKHCKDARGNFVEAFNAGANTGTLSDGGWLDGTALAVFNSASFTTPVPTEFTFTSTFALTTDHGQLNGSRIYLFDVVTGQGFAMVKVDPTASTGVFAGATGTLFFDLIKSTTIATGPYHEKVRAQICFADGNEPRDE
jgi:hypothetical protein